MRYGISKTDLIIRNILQDAIENTENLHKLMGEYHFSRPETPEQRPRRDPKNKEVRVFKPIDFSKVDFI